MLRTSDAARMTIARINSATPKLKRGVARETLVFSAIRGINIAPRWLGPRVNNRAGGEG
ncbi:MAG: hypothetical protein M0R66_00355 [Candidatus Omnitrophica bacterium]|jgi:hypothetical protein|nr:hypothetical protein [Candidatus Omnitrophota bacterium]